MHNEIFTSEISLLCSHAKLERDKGRLALTAELTTLKKQKTTPLHSFEEKLINFLTNNVEHAQWEQVFGYLQACKVLLESEMYSSEYTSKLLCLGLKFLEHDEFRVRILSGEVLGALCHLVDSNIYKECESVLIESIRKNLTRDMPADSPKGQRDAKDIFHDTAGWKCLETSMKGLQCAIEGCGEAFIQFINLQLLDLIFDTLNHTNRFVRETGYYLCASLARYGVTSKEKSNKNIADKLVVHLHAGLSDNWSQVRLAASVATRQFFQDLSDDDKKVHFKILLPPMCLNRYYLAEGVKLYNQETWRMVLGTEGKKYVETYIEQIVEFYIRQTESDNHAVREAACHCMAELGSKINQEATRPFVPRILDALHVCFKDESWPVRDTACVACGNFIAAFPEESKPLLDVLYPLFFTNLQDPIPSVRQGAAVALTNVAKAYGEEAVSEIFGKVTIGIKSIETQSANSERYEGLEKGVATYGVIKQMRDNDYDLHSNQQMYSCGSLAPKMNRGGCMDHCFKRASEPWEVADGCVYLVGEMASYPKAHTNVHSCMKLIAEATRFKHYTHYLHFYETVNKIIPVIAKGLGKRVFKQYVESFFEMIFFSLTCENALTRTAAEECLRDLSQALGPNILKGRVEQYNPSYVRNLEEALKETSPHMRFGGM